jgi:hypothetical protein
LYGAGSIEQQAVRTGWSEVGITVSSGDGPTETPDLEGCRDLLIRVLGGSR